jgi:hypothetical protein
VLGHLDAHEVIVGSKIGLAQSRIFLAEIGVDRHYRNCRVALLQQIGHGRRVGRRNGDRRHAFRQQIVDDLHFPLLIGARSRAGEQAGISLALVLAVPFGASFAHDTEKRIVEPLHHDRQCLVLRLRWSRSHGQKRRAGRQQKQSFHRYPPLGLAGPADPPHYAVWRK